MLVVDMQNDFGAKGGMFDRAGIDISGIQKAVGPMAQVIASARAAGMRIAYFKMGYRSDLSDLGAPDSVNRVRHLRMNVVLVEQRGSGSSPTRPDQRPDALRVGVRGCYSLSTKL